MGRRSVRAPQLLEIVTWRKGFASLLPVMVLMAEEASILSLAHFGRLAVMAFLTSPDTRDQNICCFLARECSSVARLAVNTDVGVVAENGIGQPHGLNVRRHHFG